MLHILVPLATDLFVVGCRRFCWFCAIGTLVFRLFAVALLFCGVSGCVIAPKFVLLLMCFGFYLL